MKPLSERADNALGLRHAGPAANLFVLGGFLLVGLGSPSLFLKAAALVLVLLLGLLSSTSTRGSGLRSPLATSPQIGLRFVLLFAAILFVAQALSVRDGETVIRLGIAITDEGLRAGGAMALRFLVILTSSLLFVAVVDPDRLAHTFIRVGVPYRYGYVLVLALRFVPFFRDELHTVREAQRMRGIHASARSLAGIRRAVRYTFVPVLVSGLLRVDSIAMSMKGRAFGLHRTRTQAMNERWSVTDTIALLVVAALALCTWLSGRFAWP